MTIAISSQMAAGLVALTSTNDDISKTQNRLNTGLAVATASDNIAVYFKAKSYADKAEDLDTTNKGIAQGVANLDVVDKALSNMKDNIKGARQMLNDALAKAVNTGTAVNIAAKTQAANAGNNNTATTRSASGTTYGALDGYTGPAATAKRLTLKGAIVDPGVAVRQGTADTSTVVQAANAHAATDSASYFQVGDVFAVRFDDPNAAPGKQSQTVFFKAADPTADIDNTATTGTAANPYVFKDLATMADAMNSAFGRANAAFTLQQESTKVGSADATLGGYFLSMQLGSATQSISFSQVSEGGSANGTTFDFQNLFGNQAQAGTNVDVQKSNGLQQKSLISNGTALLTGAPDATTITYASTTATQTDQSAVDARKQAADFFRQTVIGLAASVGDANLPGYANVLAGGTMTVMLNDSNTSSQSVSIGGAIDFTKTGGGTSTGLTSFNVGLNMTNRTTSFTDTGGAGSANFLSNNQLNAAITALDNMSTTIGQFQKSLAASKVALNSRLDFNKTVATTLNAGATSMTAADTNQEAANLAALQNRQAFGVNNLSTTKQAEQSLLQLLR